MCPSVAFLLFPSSCSPFCVDPSCSVQLLALDSGFFLSLISDLSLYPILDVNLCHRDVLIIAYCWFLFKTYSGKKWIGFFRSQVTEVIQSVSHVLQSLLNFILYKWDWTLLLPFCSKDFFLSFPVLTSFWQSKPPPLTNLRTEDNHMLHPMELYQHLRLIWREKGLRKTETTELGRHWIALTFWCIARFTFHSSAAILSTSEDFLTALSNV